MPLITNGTYNDVVTVEYAKKLAIAAIEAVTEREIKTGDDFVYHIIKKEGVEEFRHGLRRDWYQFIISKFHNILMNEFTPYFIKCH